MMYDRNYSSLTMRKQRRRRDWHGVAIVAIFVLGACLVAVAFLFRDDESDIPSAPESREILEHESARDANPNAEAHVPSPENRKKPNIQEIPREEIKQNSKNSPKIENSKSPSQQIAPTHAPTAHFNAMVDFARLPTENGGISPKLGHYAIVDSPVVYDENTSPEDILRARAKHYVVVSGDILGRIAQKHHCTIEQIQKANRMADDRIKIGQKLLIPDCISENSAKTKDNSANSDIPSVPNPL